ncbi:MAG: radical SAM protein [Promethearchaeota archaeon]|nr:MAG: radical SAM protein [Candidatus Lokiarchaeota archaeon]
MVLLINPKTSKPTEINTRYFREPNNGLLILAALLDINDIDVELLDLEQFLALNDRERREIVLNSSSNHAIIGITCLTNTFHKAKKIAEDIKSVYPKKYIVMGGPHVSFLYDLILNEANTVIDFICVGESEYSFLQLTKILLNSSSDGKISSQIENKIKNIRGIAYKANKGSVQFTGTIDNIIDIDQLPLPARYKLIPQNYYYNVANVIINRGCPNQCSFCSRQELFKSTRIRTIESIMSELRDIESSQMYKFVNFYDNINLRKGFLKELVQTLKIEDFSLPWGCELRVDNITAQEAQLMKQAGCQVIATGIESASPKVLQRNFKYQDPEKVKRGLGYLKDHNISIQAYFVLGLPGETQKTFSTTLNYIDSLPLEEEDTINYFIATPYPGSKLWEEQDRFGIYIFEHDFSKYDCEHLIFETEDLTKDQLEEMYKKAKEVEKLYQRKEPISIK